MGVSVNELLKKDKYLKKNYKTDGFDSKIWLAELIEAVINSTKYARLWPHHSNYFAKEPNHYTISLICSWTLMWKNCLLQILFIKKLIILLNTLLSWF